MKKNTAPSNNNDTPLASTVHPGPMHKSEIITLVMNLFTRIRGREIALKEHLSRLQQVIVGEKNEKKEVEQQYRTCP